MRPLPDDIYLRDNPPPGVIQGRPYPYNARLLAKQRYFTEFNPALGSYLYSESSVKMSRVFRLKFSFVRTAIDGGRFIAAQYDNEYGIGIYSADDYLNGQGRIYWFGSSGIPSVNNLQLHKIYTIEYFADGTSCEVFLNGEKVGWSENYDFKIKDLPVFIGSRRGSFLYGGYIFDVELDIDGQPVVNLPLNGEGTSPVERGASRNVLSFNRVNLPSSQVELFEWSKTHDSWIGQNVSAFPKSVWSGGEGEYAFKILTADKSERAYLTQLDLSKGETGVLKIQSTRGGSAKFIAAGESQTEIRVHGESDTILQTSHNPHCYKGVAVTVLRKILQLGVVEKPVPSTITEPYTIQPTDDYVIEFDIVSTRTDQVEVEPVLDFLTPRPYSTYLVYGFRVELNEYNPVLAEWERDYWQKGGWGIFMGSNTTFTKGRVPIRFGSVAEKREYTKTKHTLRIERINNVMSLYTDGTQVFSETVTYDDVIQIKPQKKVEGVDITNLSVKVNDRYLVKGMTV